MSNNSMYDPTKDLRHFGVLGMRWGRHKSQSSSGSSSAGGVTVSKNGAVPVKTHDLLVKGKKQSQEDFEIEVARGILSSKKSTKEEVALANNIVKKLKTNLDTAKNAAHGHNDDADLQIAHYRAQIQYDKARGKKFLRLGKKKNESDEDFDKRLNDEIEDGIRGAVNWEKQNGARAKKVAKLETIFLVSTAAIAAGNYAIQKYMASRSAQKAARTIAEMLKRRNAATLL